MTPCGLGRGDWDPERLDLASVNRRLATLPALKTKRRTLEGIAELVMLTGAWHLLSFCIHQRSIEQDTPKYLDFERRGNALTLFEILMPDAKYDYARQSRVARFRFEPDDECWHVDRPPQLPRPGRRSGGSLPQRTFDRCCPNVNPGTYIRLISFTFWRRRHRQDSRVGAVL